MTAEKVWFSRKEAATYLESRGHVMYEHTLRDWASNNNAGGGPAYLRDGWSRTRYKKEDLDRWSEERFQRVE